MNAPLIRRSAPPSPAGRRKAPLCSVAAADFFLSPRERVAVGRVRGVLLALLLATAAHAQTVVSTHCGTLVAHDTVVELLDCPTSSWKTAGVDHPGAMVVSGNRAVLLDPLASVAKRIDMSSGSTTDIKTGETPIDAAFVGEQLFILSRDSRQLERVSDGKKLATGADPQFLRVANDRLYVYGRVDGRMQEFRPEPFAVVREWMFPPFAADVEVAGNYVHLVYPREGVMRTYQLEPFANAGEEKAGAVPVDLELVAKPNVVTARLYAIADPASKRAWTVEGHQSVAQATGRGFLRGMFGLALFAGRNGSFPTGIDRVVANGQRSVAYDSSTGTIYRISSKGKSPVLATGVGPRAFAVTENGAVWWDGKALQSAKF